MSGNKPEQLTDHAYDGIQEYDNPAPGWWSFLFFGCVLFSFAYIMVMHFSMFATNPQMRWSDAQADYFERIFGDIGTLEGNEETLVAMANDDKWMTLGRGIFELNCVSCHASQGAGGTGPNLADTAWLHVKELEDIYATIDDGVVAKGMPAWGTQLSQNQVVLVSAYVATLQSQNVVGKQAEGEEVPPFDLTPAAAPDADANTTAEG